MSYDVQVYAREALTAPRLRELAGDLDLGEPVRVEAEDVPEEVTAALLGARWLYELPVEGSSESGIDAAVTLARRVARELGGVVLDLQTGLVWKRGVLRAAPVVERGRVAVVEARWYVRGCDDARPAAVAWTAAARRWVPELLPRRYGTFEPLQGKHADGGDPAFADVVGGSDGMVFFKATKPAVEGHVTGRATGVVAHGVTLFADALADPAWRVAFAGFFTEIAVATSAVLATAEVVRGVQWSGRTLSWSGDNETATYLSPRGHWTGLPPYPVWWSWFGRNYVPLVHDHLAADRTRAVGDGLFHQRSEAPTDRDELIAELPASTPARRRLWRRTSQAPVAATWLPAELLAVVEDGERGFRGPAAPASVRPRGLR